MIDTELVRLEIVRRLPIRVHWTVKGVPLDFDFSRSRAPLHPVTPNDVNCFGIENDWTLVLLFGEQDFANGGGARPYLGVHRDSGEIFGLDVEREESQVFLLNSNIDRFIRTVQTFGELLRQTPVPRNMLSNALREIDPFAFKHSEWQYFSSHVAGDNN